MEIIDILSELITVATNTMNEKGQPENFDLEDFIQTMENYYSELDDLGEFYFENDMENGYDFDGDDDY